MSAANAVCSPRERDALRALSPTLRAARLLGLWARKVAVARAIGREDVTRVLDIAVENGTVWPPSVRAIESRELPPHHHIAVAVALAEPAPVAIHLEEAAI